MCSYFFSEIKDKLIGRYSDMMQNNILKALAFVLHSGSKIGLESDDGVGSV